MPVPNALHARKGMAAMPEVFKIEGAMTEKYHGCGHALAAVTGGQIVGLVYIRDVIEDVDEEDEDAIAQAINDDRLGPTVRMLSALGKVFVGMCSCYEFVVL